MKWFISAALLVVTGCHFTIFFGDKKNRALAQCPADG
jgi:hypothetical protein